MRLKKLILDSFKGVTHGEYDFSDVTTIMGKNGTGKTTLADAWYWLFTDKDYDLQSNPEVHPDFMEESEPSVTAVLDIDGKEVTLRKFQKDMRTYWDWQARFNDWMENQFIYCFPDGKALAMPPIPRELLEADVFQEDIQKANPDMPEPSAKSPKKSKKKKKKKK
jgi:hypothetical protein